MDCHAFEDRLNAVLDERQNPATDRRLAFHAAGCWRCRQLLEDNASLSAGVAAMTTPEVRADFSDRVVAQLLASMPLTTLPSGRPSRAGRMQRLAKRMSFAAGTALSAAAAMFLMVSLVWYARTRESSRETDTARISRTIENVPSGGLALTSADFLLEAPRLPNRMQAYRGAIDELAGSLPDAAMRLDQVEHYAPGIRPLRASFSMIWEMLCRAIPNARTRSAPPEQGRTSRWWLEAIYLA